MSINSQQHELNDQDVQPPRPQYTHSLVSEPSGGAPNWPFGHLEYELDHDTSGRPHESEVSDDEDYCPSIASDDGSNQNDGIPDWTWLGSQLEHRKCFVPMAAGNASKSIDFGSSGVSASVSESHGLLQMTAPHTRHGLFSARGDYPDNPASAVSRAQGSHDRGSWSLKVLPSSPVRRIKKVQGLINHRWAYASYDLGQETKQEPFQRTVGTMHACSFVKDDTFYQVVVVRGSNVSARPQSEECELHMTVGGYVRFTYPGDSPYIGTTHSPPCYHSTPLQEPPGRYSGIVTHEGKHLSIRSWEGDKDCIKLEMELFINNELVPLRKGQELGSQSSRIDATSDCISIPIKPEAESIMMVRYRLSNNFSELESSLPALTAEEIYDYLGIDESSPQCTANIWRTLHDSTNSGSKDTSKLSEAHAIATCVERVLSVTSIPAPYYVAEQKEVYREHDHAPVDLAHIASLESTLPATTDWMEDQNRKSLLFPGQFGPPAPSTETLQEINSRQSHEAGTSKQASDASTVALETQFASAQGDLHLCFATIPIVNNIMTVAGANFESMCWQIRLLVHVHNLISDAPKVSSSLLKKAFFMAQIEPYLARVGSIIKQTADWIIATGPIVETVISPHRHSHQSSSQRPSEWGTSLTTGHFYRSICLGYIIKKWRAFDTSALSGYLCYGLDVRYFSQSFQQTFVEEGLKEWPDDSFVPYTFQKGSKKIRKRNALRRLSNFILNETQDIAGPSLPSQSSSTLKHLLLEAPLSHTQSRTPNGLIIGLKSFDCGHLEPRRVLSHLNSMGIKLRARIESLEEYKSLFSQVQENVTTLEEHSHLSEVTLSKSRNALLLWSYFASCLIIADAIILGGCDDVFWSLARQQFSIMIDRQNQVIQQISSNNPRTAQATASLHVSSLERFGPLDEEFQRFAFLCDELGVQSGRSTVIETCIRQACRKTLSRVWTSKISQGPYNDELIGGSSQLEWSHAPWELNCLNHHALVASVFRSVDDVELLHKARSRLLEFMLSDYSVAPTWNRSHPGWAGTLWDMDNNCLCATTLSVIWMTDAYNELFDIHYNGCLALMDVVEWTQATLAERRFQCKQKTTRTSLDRESLPAGESASDSKDIVTLVSSSTKVAIDKSTDEVIESWDATGDDVVETGLALDWKRLKPPGLSQCCYPEFVIFSLDDTPEVFASQPKGFLQISGELKRYLKVQDQTDILKDDKTIWTGDTIRSTLTEKDILGISVHDLSHDGTEPKLLKSTEPPSFTPHSQAVESPDYRDLLLPHLHDSLLDQNINYRIFLVRYLTQASMRAFIYIWHYQALSTFEDFIGAGFAYHDSHDTRHARNPDWITSMTIPHWSIETPELPVHHQRDFHSQRNQAKYGRFPPKGMSLKRFRELSSAGSQEPGILKLEERVSSIVISGDVDGHFYIASVISPLVDADDLKLYIKKTQDTMALFTHCRSAGRRLIFLILLGHICGKITDRYASILEDTSLQWFQEQNMTIFWNGVELFKSKGAVEKLQTYLWGRESFRVFGTTLASTRDILLRAKEDYEADMTQDDRKWTAKLLERRRLVLHDFNLRLDELSRLESEITGMALQLEKLYDSVGVLTNVDQTLESLDQNKNIRILTFITISYLPLGFVSALFALDEKILGGSAGSRLTFVVLIFFFFTLTLLSAFTIPKLSDGSVEASIREISTQIHSWVKAKPEKHDPTQRSSDSDVGKRVQLSHAGQDMGGHEETKGEILEETQDHSSAGRRETSSRTSFFRRLPYQKRHSAATRDVEHAFR